MNKLKAILVAAIAACTIQAASAALINGSIGFAGSFSTTPSDLATATGISFSNEITIGASTGDYGLIPSGTPVSFTDFSFADAMVSPIWQLTYLGAQYSFDLTSFSVTNQDSNNITVEGSGVASITGLEDTPGVFVLTANKAGANLTFSASTAVPDTGATLALLGFGLLGLGAASRRFKK